ncbi:MAG: M48 family metallopeptidase [Rhodobacteraceae bacterium]|nr:M48 family metallopeptidase [Paracoccaceae bacterium]
MLKLTPFLIMIAYGVLAWRFSAWRSARELDARSGALADPRLKAVVARLAAALGLAEVRVQVYEVPAVNGLAAADGRIFLTRGFLDRYRDGEVSAEELASVVAHELGHVALGHARRRLIDFTGQNALRLVLAGLLGRLLPGLGVWLANLAAGLFAARLSRQDEYEADAWAAALLVRAGIGTAPQKALFARLGGLAGGAGAEVPAWFLSHPRPGERIAAIEALEARWGLPAAPPRQPPR